MQALATVPVVVTMTAGHIVESILAPLPSLLMRRLLVRLRLNLAPMMAEIGFVHTKSMSCTNFC